MFSNVSSPAAVCPRRHVAWLLAALALLACMSGCSSSSSHAGATGGDSGGGGSEGGGTMPAGGSLGAGCDAVFAAFVGRCSFVGYPPSELTRVGPRFRQYCEALYALPGTDASQLAACAQAVTGVDCNAPLLPASCNGLQVGTLGSGAPCTNGIQCASGSCTSSADGGAPPDAGNACGTCDAPLGVGQDCSGAGYCVVGTTCDPTSSKCVPIVQGDAGAGGSCVVDSDCVANLQCGPAGTCATPNATVGQPCPCAGTLQCGGDNTCINEVYLPAGQTCDGLATSCLVGGGTNTGAGNCAFPQSTYPLDDAGADDASFDDAGAAPADASPTDVGTADANVIGICPTVVADGQSCDPNSSDHVCDTFAFCINGTCQVTGIDACF